MAKSSRIELPDGTIIEISPSMEPEQIQAIIRSLRTTSPTKITKLSSIKTGEVVEEKPDPIKMWQNGSKRIRLALFIRSAFNESMWLSANQIRDEQLVRVKKLVLGESSEIHTYLKRLNEEGYLERRKQFNRVKYKMNDKFLTHFPDLQLQVLTDLMKKAAVE